MSLQDVDLQAIARETDGYTGSDIEALVREAGMLAVEDALSTEGSRGADGQIGSVTVTADHIQRALAASKPSVPPERREYYEQLDERGVR
jgi:transitional endoplasmic reticulum ATPase